MKKSKYCEVRIVRLLREADRDTIADVAKRHGVSEASIYAWCKRFGGMAATCAVLALGACAGISEPPLLATEYVCAEGGFTLRTRGDAAEIILNRMHFALPDVVRQGATTVLSCSMLTLTQEGGVARVDMEGRPYLAQCRPRP